MAGWTRRCPHLGARCLGGDHATPPADRRRPALARSEGLPVPSYDLIAELPHAHAIVQQRLTGAPPSTVDRTLVEDMVAATDRMAELLADRLDVPTPDLHLATSGPGFCLHETLATYDDRTRRLLDRVRAIGRRLPTPMHGTDLVHLDFHPGNILVDATGRLTGIVDWNGMGRGDRWFAVVTLRFDLTQLRVDPALMSWLDALIEANVAPAALDAYWAHLSLRLVDWTIRHHGPANLDHWHTVADQHLDHINRGQDT